MTTKDRVAQTLKELPMWVDYPISEADIEGLVKMLDAETLRCAEIVQKAREGERDNDLRSIIHAIKNP